jgi:hypothetical protein
MLASRQRLGNMRPDESEVMRAELLARYGYRAAARSALQ